MRFFLSKVENREAGSFYQDFKLSNFEQAKATLAGKKTFFANKVSDCIKLRLEEEKDSHEIFTYAPKILNTEGWKQFDKNPDFADEGIEYIVTRFKEPLKQAGVSCAQPIILAQWKNLVEYANEFLSIADTPYRKTWHLIFNSPRRKAWADILIVIELLFTMPISNAKLERMFSKMKNVKTLARSSIKEKKLESLLRIREEGPKLDDFDPTSAIQLWMDSKYRRPNQRKRKTYKKRASKKAANQVRSLSDSDTTSEPEEPEEPDEPENAETPLFDDEENTETLSFDDEEN